MSLSLSLRMPSQPAVPSISLTLTPYSVRSVINGYSPLMPGNVRLKRFAPALLMPTKGASILVNALASKARFAQLVVCVSGSRPR